jgi:serine O-acetyltransferase
MLRTGKVTIMSDLKKRIWNALRKEVEEDAAGEPILASFLYAAVLNHNTFEESLSFHLASKLASPTLHSITLRDVMAASQADNPRIAESAIHDLKAVRERDPACTRYSIPFLYFKGYQSLQAYRIAHHLWERGRHALALQLQSRMSEVWGVDIHPAAQIGRGILLDHATGLVIGETAVVEDDVSILHEVTLGGTGKETGDRHPKVRRGVLISAGAKIFGNIEIGQGAKIGGGSVVLHRVPPHTTVAGVPARPVGKPAESAPAKAMDQQIDE